MRDVVDGKGKTLGNGELEATRVPRYSQGCSGYTGRGGILPVGSIPRGTRSSSLHTMFEVKSFTPCG